MQSPLIRRAIIVCALGYFVDIFDIQLFAVLRVSSLTALGVPADKLSLIGGSILNAQMAAMIAGAFLWGWLGDRFGRLKPLYGSILIYSIGTLACSLVHDPVSYGICRFITGFGLAGETGAAVTLVSELMPTDKRAWGVTIVGGVGAFGPFFALLLSYFMDWRATYVAAGLFGLGLFVLRMRLVEPALFQKMLQSEKKRGSLKMFLQPRTALVLLCCVAIILPCAYAVNLLNFYSLEIGRAVLRPGEILNQKSCMFMFYIGLGLGNTASGTISQLWQSRRKTMISFFLFSATATAAYLLVSPLVKISAIDVYAFNFVLGLATGTFTLITLITAEQFGTDIRATSTVLVSNAVRAGVIPMVFAFQYLKGITNVASAAALIGGVVFAAAFLALSRLRETHGLDLDYVEAAANAIALPAKSLPR
ncbi:MAG: MFS transporter [Alphaproteobacteria bacterium]|nr:MFS transporter [Alphaproteobacteria bacterium]